MKPGKEPHAAREPRSYEERRQHTPLLMPQTQKFIEVFCFFALVTLTKLNGTHGGQGQDLLFHGFFLLISNPGGNSIVS